jgi:hypothetical protein
MAPIAQIVAIVGSASSPRTRCSCNRSHALLIAARMSGAGQPGADAVALAATYRAAVFVGLSPIAWRCSSDSWNAAWTRCFGPPCASALAGTTTTKPHPRGGPDAHGAPYRRPMGARTEIEPGMLSELESLEVSHQARADCATGRPRGQRFSLPSAQDCYHCANRCLEIWNDSDDHAALSWLLRMADTWLRLASESDKRL